MSLSFGATTDSFGQCRKTALGPKRSESPRLLRRLSTLRGLSLLKIRGDSHTFRPPDLAKKALDLTSAHSASVDLAAKSRALKDTEDWLTAELAGIQKVIEDALDSRRKL